MTASSSDPLVGVREEHAQETVWQKFTQQRLDAWQPSLPHRCSAALYFTFGCIFLASGVMLSMVNSGVDEYARDYTDLSRPLAGENIGHVDFYIENDMEPPVWVFYELEGFHQNHRRYVSSRVPDQMSQTEDPDVIGDSLSDCAPWVMEDDRVNYPCGLVARSVFNDTFVLQVKNSSSATFEMLPMDSSAAAIAWSADRTGTFINLDPEATPHGAANQQLLNMWILERFPPVYCEQTSISDDRSYIPVRVQTRMVPRSGLGDEKQEYVKVLDCKDYMSQPSCNFERGGTKIDCEGPDYRLEHVQDWGIASGHFMVWMRVAGLPKFRKLFGRINTMIPAGSIVRVHFSDDFPVTQFLGRKSVVLSTSSVFGGRSPFLGYGYLAMGSICILLVICSLFRLVPGDEGR